MYNNFFYNLTPTKDFSSLYFESFALFTIVISPIVNHSWPYWCFVQITIHLFITSVHLSDSISNLADLTHG